MENVFFASLRPKALGEFLLALLEMLLMVQKSGIHQLRLVVYPIICRVSYIPGFGDRRISSISIHQKMDDLGGV